MSSQFLDYNKIEQDLVRMQVLGNIKGFDLQKKRSKECQDGIEFRLVLNDKVISRIYREGSILIQKNDPKIWTKRQSLEIADLFASYLNKRLESKYQINIANISSFKADPKFVLQQIDFLYIRS